MLNKVIIFVFSIMQNFTFSYIFAETELNNPMNDEIFANSDFFIKDVVTKVYIKPEKISHDENFYFLELDENDFMPLSNLQVDQNGYFIEVSSQGLNREDLVLSHLRFKISQECPLCGTPGYIAGMCRNEKCPGKENRRKYQEQRRERKEEAKKRKKEKQ